jgi:tight adherence protein B
MPIETTYFLYGAIFFGALLLAESVYLAIIDNRPGRRKANRRMAMLASGKDAHDVYQLLRRNSASKARSWDVIGPVVTIFETLIIQSGLTIRTKRLVVIMAALFCAGLFGYLLFTAGSIWPRTVGNLMAALGAGVAGGGLLPILYLYRLKAKRLKRFAEQLPDALDVMVRSLRAGHPVNAAMGLATAEMSDPMGTELGIAVDEMTYGLDLREALENLGQRVPLQDFQYVIVAIGIQSETGGNLADVLSSLASVIRQRFQLFRKVRALSGEGRVSAWMLSVLPFLTIGAIFAMSPEFYLDVLDDPIFVPVAGGVFALMLAGIAIMYRMVNFRV